MEIKRASSDDERNLLDEEENEADDTSCRPFLLFVRCHDVVCGQVRGHDR